MSNLSHNMAFERDAPKAARPSLRLRKTQNAKIAV